MQLPYSEKLNIEILGRLFDNKSECYKLFWFQAIMTKIKEGKQEFSFDELINEMISDAWYMVSEYHLNLGPKDNLEMLVEHLSRTTGILPNVKKSELLHYLKVNDDKKVMEYKRKLMANVPYRLQAPFLQLRGSEWNCGAGLLAEKINKQPHLMYYFTIIQGLNSCIRISDEWMSYLSRNQEIIGGWIQYNMISYLQRRNPSTPGIADKLFPPQERKLIQVTKYWKALSQISPIYDIYGNTQMNTGNISIDHFVPWSYVAHDELWNLHPTTRSINSSKSNNLPKWEHYFPLLAELEYTSYQMIWKYDSIHELYDKCAKEHLNNADVQMKLYREGMDSESFKAHLYEVIYPVYMSAKNSGFREWEYSGK